MKKVVGLIGGLVLVAAVALAGVKTDKLVFGDDTEMTTAAGAGTPPATNTTTTAFTQPLAFADTLNVADLKGIFLGDDQDTKIYFDGLTLVVESQTVTPNDAFAFWGFDLYYFENNMQIAADSKGLFFGEGQDAQLVFDGGDFFIQSEEATPNDHLVLYNWDYVWSDSPVHVATDTDNLLLGAEQDAYLTFDGAHAILGSKNVTANDELWFDDFDNYNFDRGNVVLNNDAAAGAHLIATMDDAAGTDCTMVEWAIGSNADQDGNWRMGIAESNLVVQVRVSGVWTNATAFQRP